MVVVVCSPVGLETLSSHYWHLLAKLVVNWKLDHPIAPRDMEVMRLLEKAEDWEKLGAWMIVVWTFLPWSTITGSESTESIEEATLKLLLQQPSTLRGFEDLCKAGRLRIQSYRDYENKLKLICDQARAKQSPPDSLPWYASICPDRHPSVLTPTFFASGNRFAPSHFFTFLLWEITALESIYYTYRGLMYRVRMDLLE